MANQTSTFQAPLWPRMSSQETTPVTSISAFASSTTPVASMNCEPTSGSAMSLFEPTIHKKTASATTAAITHSCRLIGPIRRSSCAAHAGTSRLDWISGG